MSFWSTSSNESRRQSHRFRSRSRAPWQMILDHAYPLPPALSGMCRDAFLAQLLQPYESSTSTLTLSSRDSIFSSRVKFHDTIDMAYNVEARLLNKMLTGERRLTSSRLDSLAADATVNAPDLNKLMKERYGNIASAIGFMAVIAQLQQLKDRMLIFRELWNMSATVDKDLRLFSWSIQDYLFRFSQPNQVYLDTAERLLGTQIECFKFRMDLREINRLIDAVIDDVRSKRNVCDGAMEIIRDAEVDIEELLTKSQREANEQHSKVAKAAVNTPRSADPFGTRAKAIHTRINYNDFVYPIEARYRIKWAQTMMEQCIYGVQLAEQRLSDEVNGLHDEIEEAGRFWDISSIAFNTQVLELKDAIMKREILYEKAMEEAENRIQMTRQRLLNAKNDLVFYREQIPMFHRKIAEVQLLKAHQQEEALNQQQLQQQLQAKKPSRNSGKGKAKKKKA